uniref:Cytoplasmic tRNA 2-thiolation protein 2 n=1 Tax=Rhipicephalus pulchellus TaxID=72859 RepID=L7M1D3_RHIPC
MCSNSCDCEELNESELAPNAGADAVASTSDKTCKTCGDTAHLVLRKKDAYCKTCFVANCTHKFRATLGKSKLLKPGNKVLVAFSGGPSSAAMLRLLRDGFSEDTHKKLLFEPSLVYVYDDSSVLGTHGDVTDLMKESGFPYYTCSLDSLYSTERLKLDPSSRCPELGDSNGAARTAFAAACQSFKTLTDRESFYRLCLRRLLLRLARDNGFLKVFTAETGTSLAATLLTTIALGRGAQLREEVGFVDDRDPRVLLLRPMREFSSEEVQLFNEHCNVRFRAQTAPSAGGESRASVFRLTAAFVNGLQENFPATVSTVWRTGDKIESRPRALAAGQGSSSRCRMCGSPLDTVDVEPCSAVAALQLTRDISRLRLEEDAKSTTYDVADTLDVSSSTFCYACQALVRQGDASALSVLCDVVGDGSNS